MCASGRTPAKVRDAFHIDKTTPAAVAVITMNRPDRFANGTTSARSAIRKYAGLHIPTARPHVAIRKTSRELRAPRNSSAAKRNDIAIVIASGDHDAARYIAIGNKPA